MSADVYVSWVVMPYSAKVRTLDEANRGVRTSQAVIASVIDFLDTLDDPKAVEIFLGWCSAAQTKTEPEPNEDDLTIDDFIDDYEIAEHASVQAGTSDAGIRYAVMTINGKRYRLSLNQSWRLADALRDI